MIYFARLCEDDVIKIGSTEDDPRRRLSKLKVEFGPVREVIWLDDDDPQVWRALDQRFNFHQRFHHLYIKKYRSKRGEIRGGVYRADPELLEFIATLDPATSTQSTAAATAVWRARRRAAQDARLKATAEVFGRGAGDDGYAAQYRFTNRRGFLMCKQSSEGLSEDETAELDQLEDQQDRWLAAFQRHRSSVEQPSLAEAAASDGGRSDHPGGKEGGAGAIYFARICEDIIKIGYTAANRRNRLRQLEREYGITIQHVVWIEGDLAAEAAYHQRFDHLRLGFRRGIRSGGPSRELFRAGPELIAFLATVDPASGLALAAAIRADEEQAKARGRRNHRRRSKEGGSPAPRSWSEVRVGMIGRDFGPRLQDLERRRQARDEIIKAATDEVTVNLDLTAREAAKVVDEIYINIQDEFGLRANEAAHVISKASTEVKGGTVTDLIARAASMARSVLYGP